MTTDRVRLRRLERLEANAADRDDSWEAAWEAGNAGTATDAQIELFMNVYHAAARAAFAGPVTDEQLEIFYRPHKDYIKPLAVDQAVRIRREPTGWSQMNLVRETTDDVAQLLSYPSAEDVPDELRALVEEQRRLRRRHPSLWAHKYFQPAGVKATIARWLRDRLVLMLLDDEGEHELRAEVTARDEAGIVPHAWMKERGLA